MMTGLTMQLHPDGKPMSFSVVDSELQPVILAPAAFDGFQCCVQLININKGPLWRHFWKRNQIQPLQSSRERQSVLFLIYRVDRFSLHAKHWPDRNNLFLILIVHGCHYHTCQYPGDMTPGYEHANIDIGSYVISRHHTIELEYII